MPRIPGLSKLPFLKGRGDADDMDAGPPPGDDALSYLDKTPFQRRLPWMAVAGGYAFFILLAGGTVFYLISNESAIEDEMRALRPSLEVERLKVVPRGTGKASSTAPKTAETAEAPTEEAGSPDAEQPGEVAEAAEQTGDEAPPQVTDGQDGFDPESGEDAPGAYAGLLHPHPDPSLVEESPIGPLPRIGDDGRQPWRVYARPFSTLERRPKIAVIVSELGISEEATEKAIKLPDAFSLAFAPYSRKIVDYITQARDAGHEVLLTLPMEPVDFPRSDPGPYALMTTLDKDQNLQRLQWILTRATGYVGLVNFQGSRFTTNKPALNAVLSAIKDRGLMYLDTRETSVSAATGFAKGLGMPNVAADLVVDDPPGPSVIRAKLARAEALARANGAAVIMARPYPVTLKRLREWARELPAKGIALIPVSAIPAAGYKTAQSG